MLQELEVDEGEQGYSCADPSKIIRPPDLAFILTRQCFRKPFLALPRRASAAHQRRGYMSNLRWHIQTLSVPSSDTNASLLVNFENDKYLFECPESTSRAFIQNKVSGKKVTSIFLSKLDQEAAGGLFGLFLCCLPTVFHNSWILTGALLGLRENGVKQIDIYGPPGIEHFLAAGRYFTRR